MRAVRVDVTDEELAHRRSIGADHWDEMWEGVLHMAPAPNLEHQRILSQLVVFLEPLLRLSKRGTLFPGVNVFRTTTNYRIPDLTFVATGREDVLSDAGVREGGSPDAVIEIRSPEDETYEKFPFYAAIGTREVIVIDRDTKRPEIYRLAGSELSMLQPDAEGWVRAETMRVRFRQAEKRSVLQIEDLIDATIAAEV
jgi:Uma2 family endonuclease